MKQKILLLAAAVVATMMIQSCNKKEKDDDVLIYSASSITLVVDGESHDFAVCSDLGQETLVHWPGCKTCNNIIYVDNPEGNPD